MIGRRLAHYEITEKLGEGGMGEVYLARDTQLERQIALKVLPAELAADPGRLARFEREAKAVAALNHPSIVHVYSVEEIEGVHFFTMEWVDGETLRDVIPEQGLDLSRLLDLAIRLADALTEAHEHGVIHRDLKPSNIMIDPHGRPKILDFGLAKLRLPRTSLDSQLPTATLHPEDVTQEGAILGTCRYMSPEQIGGRAVDHRSDLFSLGIVLYEMACGRSPFEGDTAVSVMAAILKETPSPIRSVKPALPEGLQALLDTCLDKDVESRIQSAAELHDKLAALAPGATRHPSATSAQRSDIFISYSRKDRPAAEALAHHLERHGWSVWWDREIAAGETFDEVIEEAMCATRCVTVLWSEHSVGSRWVRAEAEEGAKRNILVPVLLDAVDIPLAFRQIQAADLAGWDGSAENLAGGELTHAIQRILEPTGDKLQRGQQGSADHAFSLPVPGKGSASAIRRPLLAALGLLVLVALVLTLLQYRPWRGKDEGTPLVTSLAVLPLENLSGDPEQDYYAAGITEGLIADLSRVSALRVISRQSVMRFKGSDKSLPEIAEELGVEALIEGSVLPVGDRVRVTAQLVQAHPEQHLWAETYERDAQDVLALLSEVTRAITTEVRVAVSPDEEALLTATRQVDPEAHRAYLRGRYFEARLGLADTEKALVEYQRATEIDPDFASAWAGVALMQAHRWIWVLGLGEEVARAEAYDLHLGARENALALDDGLSTAYTAKALMRWQADWDWRSAEADFRGAIEHNPNDSAAHFYYSTFLVSMGRFDEARREIAITGEIDPLAPLEWVRGDIHHFSREFEPAIALYERSIEISPSIVPAFYNLALGLWASGRPDEVVDLWQAGQRNDGNYELADAWEGLSLDEVNRMWLDFAIENPEIATPDIMAQVYCMIDEPEEALQWLERAYATKGDPGRSGGWWFPYLKVDPVLDGLRDDPRFQDLLERMNLAD